MAPRWKVAFGVISSSQLLSYRLCEVMIMQTSGISGAERLRSRPGLTYQEWRKGRWGNVSCI